MPPVQVVQIAAPKSGFRRYGWRVLATGSSFVVTILVAKGYWEWIPDWTLAPIWLACLIYWAWAEGHVRAMSKNYPILSCCAVFVLLVVSLLAVFYRSRLLVLVYPSKDAKYIPSTNKLARFDGNMNQFVTPSQCNGLPDDKERECLCPRPLDYKLTALPTPSDNNYATLLNVRAGRDDMYRIAIFGRTPMCSGKILEAIPNGPPKGSLAVMEMEVDRYALGLTSSGPEREFDLEIKTSEGLRIKCVNQIN